MQENKIINDNKQITNRSIKSMPDLIDIPRTSAVKQVIEEHCNRISLKLKRSTSIKDKNINYLSEKDVGIDNKKCKEYEYIEIEDGVKELCNGLFYNNEYLKYIKIPKTVSYIGDSAFKFCKNLSTVLIDQDSLLENINESTFYGCEKLKKIYIPNKVNTIGDCAFGGCKKLNNIVIPDQVVYMGEQVFCDCEKLEHILLSKSLNKIGDFAFWGCKELKSVDIPDQVTSIGDTMFLGCRNLENITIPERLFGNLGGSEQRVKQILGIVPNVKIKIKTCFEQDKDGYYVIPIEGKQLINQKDVNCFKRLNKSDIKIPECITTIEARAFENYSSLKRIYIPNTVTEIGSNAFSGCEQLSEIKGGKNVKDIGANAFWNCKKLETIDGGAKSPIALFIFNEIEQFERRKKNAYDYLEKVLGIKKQDLESKIAEFDEFNKNYGKSIDDCCYDKDDPAYLIKQDLYIKNDFEVGSYIVNNLERDGKSIEDYNIDELCKVTDLYEYEWNLYKGARNGLFEPCKRWGIEYIEDNKKYPDSMREISEIVSHYRNNKDILLYRGLQGYDTLDKMVLGGQKINTFKNSPQSLIGKIISDDSFTSTTMKDSVANIYSRIDSDKHGSIVFKLFMPKGINMVPIYNDQSELVVKNKQKYIVLDVIRVGCGKKEIIAVALPSDEVGISRYSPKGEDKGFSRQSSEELYEEPEFSKLQEVYEIELGKYIYNDNSKAKEAVQIALNRVANKYKEKYFMDYNNNIEKFYRDIFLIDRPDLSGAVGKDIDKEEIFAMLEIDTDTSQDIKQKIDKKVLQAGNLREKLMAFQVAVDFDLKDKQGNSNPKILDIFKEMKERYTKDILIESEDKDPKERKNLIRNSTYQDDLKLMRSNRERQYQEKYIIEDNSPITYGEMMKNPKFGMWVRGKLYESIPRGNFMGKRVLAGTSQTAMKLLNACIKLDMTHTDLINFRLALLGWLIPERDNSLYEILIGSHQAGVVGEENLLTAQSMDQTVDPLSEDTLRKKACKYNSIGYQEYNGYFPIEAMAEIKEYETIELPQVMKNYYQK